MQYIQDKSVALTTSWTEVDPNFIIEYASIYVLSGNVEAELYNTTGWFKLESGTVGEVIKFIESAKKIRIRASSGVASVNYYINGNPFLISSHEEINNPDDNDYVLLEDITDSNRVKKVTVGNLVHKTDRNVTDITSDTTIVSTQVLDNIYTVEPILVDITVTLPDVTTTDGEMYSFKHIGLVSKKVNITAKVPDLIDGEISQQIRQHDNLVLISDGIEWRVI